jgi:glycosyl-4,4'-diaponeurosporenoate acyltransferase
MIRLSSQIAIMLDIVGWLVIHLGVAKALNGVKIERFNPDAWLYRERKFEKNGQLYTGLFRIKRWKDRLPDGAAIFKKGFRKKHLLASDPEYLGLFLRETCRAELTHWIVIFISPVFFLWNLEWVGWIMILYALLVNLPCIIAQRYNRIRIAGILKYRFEYLNPGKND